MAQDTRTAQRHSIFSLLAPYKGQVITLALLTVISSGLGLVLPKIVSHGIDSFITHKLITRTLVFEFSAVMLGIFISAYLQSIMQVYASERVAKDLRNTFAAKISRQSHAYVEGVTPSKLLTNLTADIDSIKLFVSQAVASLLSAIIIIVGAGALLLSINWKLGLVILIIVPIIGFLFFFVFGRVRTLIKESRAILDRLNKVINESILGAALIRVINAHHEEGAKFADANSNARNLGISILKMFATLIPVITFVSNLATLAILALGGKFIIEGQMTLGDFAAFQSYVALFIFPVLVLGVMSSIISQAAASYERIADIIDAPETSMLGSLTSPIKGGISLDHISKRYGEKEVLKDISFSTAPRSRTAIIGPTAAGKTQLLYLLTGLTEPTSGVISFDGHPLAEYDSEALHRQIGFVFQDSIIFNLSLRENIAFGDTVTDESMRRAIETAELSDLIKNLPQGLETIVSERGASLSGGQKQRIMLARALALEPKILLLDDFTARVDRRTEDKILENISKNYPDLTLVSVTQKIAPVENYDKIILLMEGELVAQGTHEELLASSPEYAQIFDSQKSTQNYEQ